MATVVALVPDLLFGSRVQGLLAAGGHDVTLVATPVAAASALDIGAVDVLVVDLVTDLSDGVADGESLQREGLALLGFYAHTAPEVRDRALAAGFAQVVPRSRMNREGAQLVAALVGT